MNIARSNRFIVEPRNLFVYITFAILLTIFLFYIDEGYYSFAWMAEPGAWFVFSIYSFAFLVVQLLADAFSFRNVTGLKKAITTISILFAALFLIVLLISLIRMI